MTAAADGGSRSLEETPTWGLASICFVFIFLGLLIEYLIHLASHWLQEHKKSSLFEAMEKLKEVLMLLGFMSLLLTATQRTASKICISDDIVGSMKPCRSRAEAKTARDFEHNWVSVTQNALPKVEQENDTSTLHHRRELLDDPFHKFLDHCSSKGMTSLISEAGISQLNIFADCLYRDHYGTGKGQDEAMEKMGNRNSDGRIYGS